MNLTESQVARAAECIKHLEALEAYKSLITNLDMNLSMTDMVASMAAVGLDGAGLVDEFKNRGLAIVEARQRQIRREEIDPLGIIIGE